MKRVRQSILDIESHHGRQVRMRREFNAQLMQGGGRRRIKRKVGSNARSKRAVSHHDTYFSGPELSKLVKRIADRRSARMIKVIDPCAGQKQLTPKGAVAADLHPIVPGVRKVNFLTSTLRDYGVRRRGKILMVMNPPFKIGVNKDGWVLFLNKAGDLCRDRPGSCVLCVGYASTSINVSRIDDIHPHLHLLQEHRFPADSPVHVFTKRNGDTKIVPIIVQVWQWKRTTRRPTPFASYVPSKTIPFELHKTGHQYRYYVKIWNSPAKVGEICVKTGMRKEKGRYMLRLTSVSTGKATKGSVRATSSGTVIGVNIRRGYTQHVIDWFDYMYRNHKWVDKHTALRNYTLRPDYIYYAYEKKRIPTLQSCFGTKIVQHAR